jgi:hypothetical protein
MDTNLKQNDNLDVLVNDIKECKYSIEKLLEKILNNNYIENNNNWPAILNSLSIISSDIISISKFIRDDNKRDSKKDDPTMMKTSVLVPRNFSQDADDYLRVGLLFFFFDKDYFCFLILEYYYCKCKGTEPRSYKDIQSRLYTSHFKNKIDTSIGGQRNEMSKVGKRI